MLEPKFKIGDVVYFYINDYNDDYYLYKNDIESITISEKGVTYRLNLYDRMHSCASGTFQRIDESELFSDLELCKAVHIAKKIKMLRDKIEQVPHLVAQIKLTDYTEFTISEEEQAHNK